MTTTNKATNTSNIDAARAARVYLADVTDLDRLHKTGGACGCDHGIFAGRPNALYARDIMAHMDRVVQAHRR